MTLATRVRLVAGGAGSFPWVHRGRSLSIAGFWNQVSSPHSQTHGGKTFIGWTNDAGDIGVAEYVHATGLASAPVTLVTAAPAVDGAIHVSPCVLVRSSDQRILASLVANGGTHQPGVWISTSPEDATAFPAGADIGPAGVYTYASVVQLNGIANDPIYLFVHHWSGGTRRLCYLKSEDQGATWGSLVVVLTPALDTSCFTRVSSDGDTRIDIYATDSDRATPASSVYHFRLGSDDNLYHTDGSLIGAIPLASDDGALVHDNSLGSAGVSAATYDGSGNPVASVYIDLGGSSAIRRCAWDGSAWQRDTVVADVGGVIGGNANISSAAVADLDPDTFYVPVKVGGVFELHQFTWDGAWTETAITSGSAADNAMPECPLGAGPGCRVLWGQGTYTDDFNFAFDLMVYG